MQPTTTWRQLMMMALDPSDAFEPQAIDVVARSLRSAAVAALIGQAPALAAAGAPVRVLLRDRTAGLAPEALGQAPRSWFRVMPDHARRLFRPDWTYASVGGSLITEATEDAEPTIARLAPGGADMHRLGFDAGWARGRTLVESSPRYDSASSFVAQFRKALSPPPGRYVAQRRTSA